MKKLILKYIPQSWQKKWYYFKNPGMIDEVEIAQKLLFMGDKHHIMIDVGAHIGNSLETFARNGWTVYAFEPDPKNLFFLKKLSLNYPKVTIEDFALGDKETDDMPYFTSEVSSGISGLLHFHDSHKEVKKVNVGTLKNYCEKNNIKNISFLKSDTEGYDLPVLKGFNWSNPHPRVIVCEFDNFKSQYLNYSLADQAVFLIDKGYKLIFSEWYPLNEYGKGHKWKRFTFSYKNINNKEAWGNIIAVKENDLDLLKSLVSKHGKIEIE
jgi:FkbM family methyltransferase